MNTLVLLAVAPMCLGPVGIAPGAGRPPAVLPAPPAAPPPGTAGAVSAPGVAGALPVVFRFVRRKALVPPHDETIRYDVSYGLLGSIGSLRVDAGAPAGREGAPATVRLQGEGGGSILGFGAMRTRIESWFDAAVLGSRRWRSARGEPGTGGRADARAPIVDDGAWDTAGQAHLLRREPGRPDEAYSFRAALQTSDPLGLIWRVRTMPPALGASDTLQVVDGLALWRVRRHHDGAGGHGAGRGPGAEGATRRGRGDARPLRRRARSGPSRAALHHVAVRAPGHVPLRIAIPLGSGEVVLRLAEARRRAGTAPLSSATPVPGARSL